MLRNFCLKSRILSHINNTSSKQLKELILNKNNSRSYNYNKFYGYSLAFTLGITYSVKKQNQKELNKAKACGIIGMVSDEQVVPYLLEGLTILQNRGYDSAGLASVNSELNKLKCTKYASNNTTSDSLDRIKSEVKYTILYIIYHYIYIHI